MSKNESGHAKNIANATLLCSHIAALGAKYNPSNSALLLTISTILLLLISKL